MGFDNLILATLRSEVDRMKKQNRCSECKSTLREKVGGLCTDCAPRSISFYSNLP